MTTTSVAPVVTDHEHCTHSDEDSDWCCLCRMSTCSHCLQPVADPYEHLNLAAGGDAWLWSCVAR